MANSCDAAAAAAAVTIATVVDDGPLQSRDAERLPVVAVNRKH